ncbi:MAG: DNA methylase [Alloprevotella sp.]|nr:DNA methylase [Alloprevotella sp.]
MPTEPSRTYIAIDLKSFYASVECVDRGLDPLKTNLVVADKSRTEKTICLAVSPSLKAYGIAGRARLFEVVQRVREVNLERLANRGRRFTGKSSDDNELRSHPEWELDYIIAPPRMAYYIDVSTKVYEIYLKYIAPEDIHVYSIDEVFMDVTNYLWTYKMTAHELAVTIIRDVLRQTGITATAGIGTNMYLCKVAMDIVAKHTAADQDGVRIGELDEKTYREKLWNHRPLTSFWRVGRGIAKRLAPYGIDTMGKIARLSVQNDELLYKLFGVNAELLIDHAWGWEPCTIGQVKAYVPESNSFSSGQVLTEPYNWKKARVVIREMADAMALKLVRKRLLTDQIVITIGYDVESLMQKPGSRPSASASRASSGNNVYSGPVTTDHYGRKVPKHATGTANIGNYTSSSALISKAVEDIYDQIANPRLLIRRLYLTVGHVVTESFAQKKADVTELDLFTDYEAEEKKKEQENIRLNRERRLQEARLAIRKRYGKNAILKGLNFDEGATAISRNAQIGGHKA